MRLNSGIRSLDTSSWRTVNTQQVQKKGSFFSEKPNKHPRAGFRAAAFIPNRSYEWSEKQIAELWHTYIIWREELINDLISQFVDVFIFMIL